MYNAFVDDVQLGSTLAVAINASRLETLDLTCNSGLGDTFISSFLPLLESCSLRKLRLAVTGITAASASHISDYLSSNRCYLTSFSCHANHLGNAGVCAIYESLSTSNNHRLTKLNTYPNFHAHEDESLTSELQRKLNLFIARNKRLKEKTQADALLLLQYSRLLLHSTPAPTKLSEHTSLSRGSAKPLFPSSLESPFLKLPTEMKQPAHDVDTMAVDVNLKNSRVYYLAFIVYWGILLFGYDTGIAGGVVSQLSFQQEFGLRNPDGTKNEERTNRVSSLVVSVLQAGAFFGALGSAPASSKFGRKPTLLAFTLVFSLGAILATAARDHLHHGLELIYAGRVVSGLGIGGISAVAPAFVSECAPKEVAMGVMISYFINFGVSQYNVVGPNVWRIPFGLQLIPAGIMLFGLLTVKESPRYLASIGRTSDATQVLAYLRKVSANSEVIAHEMAEIEAQADEESTARHGVGFWKAIRARGGGQWGGQNSVGYYAPQIFEAIGFTGTNNSLLASGVYGVVKVLATSVFVFLLVETLGRRPEMNSDLTRVRPSRRRRIRMEILLCFNR
ncbi:hypothetical protein DXG01_009203 [Tephrocybe rancida]|nr:hypothetical protein DXG01_009203 [Tephrocybe rancida]